MPTDSELKQMQSLPLDIKIRKTKARVIEWYEYWEGMVYLAFSGGIDSTVLKHIVDSIYKDVPSVFVNTGLEYPEIQQFVKDVQNGKYECFNSDVVILRPEMRFDEVIKKYGYPIISKENSLYIRQCQHPTEDNAVTIRLRTEGIKADGTTTKIGTIPSKYLYLIDAPFYISEKCCNVMKKKPGHVYSKTTGRKAILATMTDESRVRYRKWLKFGCNAFETKEPTSNPMSFWTEQDVLQYIKQYNVPYASVYGDIVPQDDAITIDDILGNSVVPLKTTGCDRTGCIFCGFGCHLEKEPNRFQRLKETHPRQYDYCINGGEYDENGRWIPNKDGLGMSKVLDYINVKY